MTTKTFSVIIYTYNKVVDAKINQAIIRQLWQTDPFFKKINIVHAYNGKKTWYSKTYLEDKLIRTTNPGHFAGAAKLIDLGVKVVARSYPQTDYLIVLAADTWLIKPDFLKDIINKMIDNKLYLASCAWNIPERMNITDNGMATDFFIVDWRWALKYKMLPFNYDVFYKKFAELFLYIKGSNISLEKLAFMRYLQASFLEFNDNNNLRPLALSKMYQIKEREPIHSHIDSNGFWQRQEHWPKIGLLTDNNPEAKKIINTTLKNKPVLKTLQTLLKQANPHS
jgi:hypothetical protein